MQRYSDNYRRPTRRGMTGEVMVSPHCRQQMLAKGFTGDQVRSAIRKPEKVTDVRAYPGQKRYCGAGVAVVMDGNTAITVYADGVVTDLRPDQMSDARALTSARLARR